MQGGIHLQFILMEIDSQQRAVDLSIWDTTRSLCMKQRRN